ncbi:MAG: hypothetical protein ACKVIA_05030 [Rhodobacterales bacterium]|jgi:hypothetical protein|tara:strand:+ start:2361 stop:3263 length:903 start_codon:yes stop_codon:yes gene_type:complete
MAQGPQTKSTEGRSAGEVIALVLSIGWMILVGTFFYFLPPTSTVADRFDSLRFILILIAIFMPVAMIWVATAASQSARIMKEESGRLQAAIDGMRKTYIENRAGPVGGMQPTVEKKLKITSVQATTSDDQPTLALGTSAEDISQPLPNPDLIRALNFPDNEQDTRGFNALRLALKDRNTRQLVQAAQDILTLMSQDGIYMDDLRPDCARAEIWRRFAHGERGRAMASLGGIRDRSSLALTSGRMREDTIYRDAAHHFLRRFDQTLITFEPNATDEEISALSETRTARAFMLLGRVTGAFD